jgi:hypothetical protein
VLAVHASARSEVPPFVELAIIGQIGLGDDTEHRTGVDHHGGIEKPVLAPDGCAHDQHRIELAGDLGQLLNGALHGIQQGILEQQIVNCVRGQSEFRKDDQAGLAAVAVLGQPDCLGQIRGNIRNLRAGNTRSNPDKIVRVQRMKR